jgi:hypothetical protein
MKAVARRKGQANEQAAGFQEMGTFRCEGCGEEFFISHHPEFADQGLAERQALARKGFCGRARTRQETRQPNRTARLIPQIMDRKSIERFRKTLQARLSAIR